MIKLVATDIDGTLLDDKKQLPDDFDEVINLLHERGITFAISSGRSYTALSVQFEKYLDKISFICDNGAYIVHNGEIISISIIEKKTVDEIVKYCNELGLDVLLCGKNGTYHSIKKKTLNDEVNRYYINQVYLDNIYECRDDIFKIAVFEEGGIEHHGNPLLKERFGKNINVALSGVYWTDLMNQNISKGMAIKVLQKRIGAGFNESAAFGDYLNDIEMLQSVYYSYAMSNAHQLCKDTARFVIGSNNEQSVTKQIKKLILQDIY